MEDWQKEQEKKEAKKAAESNLHFSGSTHQVNQDYERRKEQNEYFKAVLGKNNNISTHHSEPLNLSTSKSLEVSDFNPIVFGVIIFITVVTSFNFMLYSMLFLSSSLGLYIWYLLRKVQKRNNQ
ncbi:hypothetical protein [Mucilaginibacter ginsenosidivorax]|uniref:Uncharacterized protein n=1 Tax=Mucilaginibacter ginsenosidivorax TaxID=862126 RepID=A0A5B8VX52_9SPHI|nr:hypothetical protein [Mucilaginibacter ginsenosidivorax]QEC76294.1 hypothetical protein FSB76_10185 [Mucilaginibacter ginsenosidivorax]